MARCLALQYLLIQLFIVVAASCFVKLDYGSFEGNYSSTYNITYFRKIPFAAPPVGKNRFRAPQPPLPIKETYNSDQTFDSCPQRTVNGSEDCLYLGLYSRPWDQALETKRPVVVVFFGGGFIQGGGSFRMPPAGYPVLNASALNDFIFVYPNYRVNAFGFLPGAAIKNSKDSDLNPGLLDQQYALQWVNKNIAAFGGDPEKVTIWGQSAGAGSVVAQVIANGGKTSPRLFSKALVSSGFWPKTYNYDAPEAEAIYATLVEKTGCSSAPDSLECLKNVDVQAIRTASSAIATLHTANTSSFTWAPVIDGTFLVERASEATAKGLVNTDLAWAMYNEHEGENFLPAAVSSADEFERWLVAFLPSLTSPDIDRIKEVYAATGDLYKATYSTPRVRAGLINRDVTIACPGYWVAKASKLTGFVGEYTISPAKHGSDTQWWNQVTVAQKEQPLIYQGYAGAIASFFQTGDPNAHKLTNSTVPGVPSLGEGTKDEKFVIESAGFDNDAIDLLAQRCDLWRELGANVPV